MKVCGKKYLVHDHRRFRSRFRLKAPGLMVNVSRMQVPCVIGAITDSHSDVLIVCFIFDWMILIVNISWIITGTKKRRRFVATPPYIVLTDLSISYHYNEHIAPGNTASALCWLSVQVWLCSLNISWFFFVCGCKCREFFLISNTSRQLFSRAKSLISKDIKSYMTGYFHFGNNHFNSAVSDRRICKTRFKFIRTNFRRFSS